jgi:hypothetical protein
MWGMVAMAGVNALGPAMTSGGSPMSGFSNSGFFGMANDGWTVNYGAPGAVQSGATKTDSGMGFGSGSASGLGLSGIELLAIAAVGAYLIWGK